MVAIYIRYFYIQFQNPQTLFANINIPYFKDKVIDEEI